MSAVPGAPARIAVVTATAAGRRQAARLVAAWPDARMVEGPSVAEALREAWTSADAVVAFCATGIVVRVLAPLLEGKQRDPAVVVADDAGRHAVALLGGHAAGANELAAGVADLLGGTPVITTGTDVAGIPGLDTLGWPVEGAVAAVSRAILDGRPVRLEADHGWPLPALPDTVLVAAGPNGDREPSAAGPAGSAPGRAGTDPGTHRLLVTDRRLAPAELDGRTAVLRPPSLVAGVGASRGAPAAEILELLDRALAEAGVDRACLHCLATVQAKAAEPGILEAADALGVPLVTRSSQELAAIEVPHPSELVRAAVGTPSVAEAAALAVAAGPGRPGAADLLVPKLRSAMATLALARRPPRGRLAVVGLGPGARDLLTPRAVAELRRAAVVVGLDQYLDQVRDLLRPGTRILASGLGQEEARARTAVEQAAAGHAVALIGSGDAGVYAMASPALEQAGDGVDVDVVGVPGVTAGLAAAAVLGAPLGHDHAYVSLSDLHTPWPAIEARVRAAAAGDFVVLFYNPRSRGRSWQLPAALEILAEHRPPGTPVGVVRNASRPDQQVQLSTLADVDPGTVDMYSLVIVGSSQTRIVAGRMVTPRGYRWQG